MTYHDSTAFVAYEKAVGRPGAVLPAHIAQAYFDEGRPLPALRHVNPVVLMRPGPGRCAHCGRPCGERQHLAAHAVAGYEEARHLITGEVMRQLVTHCDECWQSDACKRDETTPGSGWKATATEEPGLVGAGGWCEPVEVAETLGMALIPGAPQLARWTARVLAWAFAASGLYVLSGALVTSQGLQVAHMQGPVSSLDYPGTATAGQGWNAGALRVLSGTAPGSGASAANAAETGTLLITWAMPATAAGAPSAATPSTITFNAITNVNASATGTAGYARLVANGDDAALSTTERRYQLTVGTSGSDLNFNTTAISSGGACSVTSLTLTHGA